MRCPAGDLPSCWLQPLRGMSVRRTQAELRPKAEIRSEVHRRGKSGVCKDGEEILALRSRRHHPTLPKPQRSGAKAKGRLGCRTDRNTGADAGAMPRLAKPAGGDYRGDQHLAALTALADDRELCLPQPDSNLTTTCHSGFLPIGGPSAGWLHSSLAF